MKKARIATALLVALGAASAPASATIVSPAPGTSVSADGSFNYRASIIDTICRVSFGGTVASSTVVSVTSGSASCSVGRMTFEDLPAPKTLLVVAGQLTGRWSLPLVIRYDLPIYGICRYATTFAGTWTDPGTGDTWLDFGSAGGLASIRLLSGSAPLCSAAPAISGSMLLEGVVTA